MARTSTERKVNEMADKGKDFADRASRNVKSKADQARNYARQAIDDNESTLEDLMETGGRMVSDLKDKTAETYEDGKAYAQDVIQTRPFMAIAGAFVAGAVLSRLFGSSR